MLEKTRKIKWGDTVSNEYVLNEEENSENYSFQKSELDRTYTR